MSRKVGHRHSDGFHLNLCNFKTLIILKMTIFKEIRKIKRSMFWGHMISNKKNNMKTSIIIEINKHQIPNETIFLFVYTSARSSSSALRLCAAWWCLKESGRFSQQKQCLHVWSPIFFTFFAHKKILFPQILTPVLTFIAINTRPAYKCWREHDFDRWWNEFKSIN